MITEKNFFYIPAGGVNLNVNHLLVRDEELTWGLNIYTPYYGTKRVRFGYTQFLDRVDNSPVVNLIYYKFPNQPPGILRISAGKIYRTNFSGNSWGSPIKTLTSNYALYRKKIAWTIMLSKLHLTSYDIGFYTVYDGTSFTDFTSPNTPFANYITNWRGRIFVGYYKQNNVNFYSRLKYSSIEFRYSDPWYEDSEDPSSSGAMVVNSGNDGVITGVSVVADRPFYYKEGGIYKFNGTGVIRMPYDIGAIPYTIASCGERDFFFTPDGVFYNDGGKIELASFPIQKLIEKTYRKIGIYYENFSAIGYKDYYMLYIGDLYWDGETYSNCMLVYNKRYDEWYIWSLPHKMTCFGFYIDPNSNDKKLISGDIDGYTYVWGEDYNNDNGIAINFAIKSKHFYMDDILSEKRLNTYFIISDFGSEAKLYVEYDRSGKEIEIGKAEKLYNKMYVGEEKEKDFKSISYAIRGKTDSHRGTYAGVGFKVQITGEKFT
ncbi:MAG: hypothetical protein QXX45_03315 [Candidatus Aenigmatarchaeota archaeon]